MAYIKIPKKWRGEGGTGDCETLMPLCSVTCDVIKMETFSILVPTKAGSSERKEC